MHVALDAIDEMNPVDHSNGMLYSLEDCWNVKESYSLEGGGRDFSIQETSHMDLCSEILMFQDYPMSLVQPSSPATWKWAYYQARCNMAYLQNI